MPPTPEQTRRYEVRYQPDLRPDERLHWRLYTYGPGHWCVGSGHAGTFLTKEIAEAYGRAWVATGKPPCEVELNNLAGHPTVLSTAPGEAGEDSPNFMERVA